MSRVDQITALELDRSCPASRCMGYIHHERHRILRNYEGGRRHPSNDLTTHSFVVTNFGARSKVSDLLFIYSLPCGLIVYHQRLGDCGPLPFYMGGSDLAELLIEPRENG